MCMCRLNHTLKLITRPFKALHIAVVRHLLKLWKVSNTKLKQYKT